MMGRLGIEAGWLLALLGLWMWLGVSQGTAVAADPFSALKLSQPAAGTKAPSFKLSSLDGQEISSQMLGGKVVLLNFWATWCGPCKDEMPSLQRLQQQFDPRQFLVIAVTTDLQPAGILNFTRQTGLTFPILLDEEKEVSSAFLVRGLPTTVLIGKDGTLIGRAVGPRLWDSPEAVALIKGLVEP